MPKLITPLACRESLDLSHYVHRLRILTEKSIERKSIGQHKIAVSASGGFDSSIIATLLAQKHPNVHDIELIHLYSSRIWQADERSYLNTLLEKTGQRASYIDLESTKDRQLLLPHAHSAIRPSKMFVTTGVNHALRQKAQTLGCDRLLSGDGGDQLFLCYGGDDIIIPILREVPFGSKLHAFTSVVIYQNITTWSLLTTYLLGTAKSKMESNINGSRR